MKRGRSRLAGVIGWRRVLVAACLLVVLCLGGIFVYYYVRFSRLIDARLSGDIFNNASLVFTSPTAVYVGQASAPAEVAARLRRAFYAESSNASSVGVYKLSEDKIEITPGPFLSSPAKSPKRPRPV